MSKSNTKESLDIKMGVSKNKVSSVMEDSEDDSIKDQIQNDPKKPSSSKSDLGVSNSQVATMELTESQLKQRINDDHFSSGDNGNKRPNEEIKYELVNPKENEKLMVRKFRYAPSLPIVSCF